MGPVRGVQRQAASCRQEGKDSEGAGQLRLRASEQHSCPFTGTPTEGRQGTPQQQLPQWEAEEAGVAAEKGSLGAPPMAE